VILESHGDACRLGYMRPLACLLEDNIPKSFDFLASILYDVVKSVEDLEALTYRPIGLVTRYVNARNYVTLAAELEFIDRKDQVIGRFGKLYLSIDSSSKFKKFVEGKAALTLTDLITLTTAEKIFFLWVILTKDYPFIQSIISWAVERERFTRQEAMNYAMEEAYPQSLRKISSKLDKRRRESLLKEIEEAEKFREKRLSMESKIEWIKSSQYAKYRHIAPPRLEWLVDCGVLRRSGRGKYELDQEYARDPEKLLKLASMKPGKLERFLFGEFIKSSLKAFSAADRSLILKTLIEVYSRVTEYFGERVNLNLLEYLTAIVLVERGRIADLKTIHDSFNSLALKFPDKVYVAPGGEGGVSLAYINVEEIEI